MTTVPGILADSVFDRLKEYVLRRTGLAYYADKNPDFASRLLRRFRAIGVETCGAYYTLLQHPVNGPREMDSLVGELTIGETYFFRQSEHFDLLRQQILPDLIARKSGSRTLSIWSAGSATGAEPYSLSILLRTDFGIQLAGWDVSILGTDLNVEFLTAARKGEYTNWALRGLSPELVQCCFRRQGDRFQLLREFQRDVHFAYHNLVDAARFREVPGFPFDLIVCRNVMIYFSQDQNREVIRNFHSLLQPGGWLIVGHAEYGGNLFPDFELVATPVATAYRKAPAESEIEVPAMADWFPAATPLPAPPGKEAEPISAPSAAAVPTADAARAYADRGDWAAAEAMCRQILERDPLDAAARFTLGLVLEHNGEIQAAAAEMRSTIYLDRAFALAYYHLGMLLRQSGDGAGARKAFRNLETLLGTRPAADVVGHGDGIEVSELMELTRMHQETLR